MRRLSSKTQGCVAETPEVNTYDLIADIDTACAVALGNQKAPNGSLVWLPAIHVHKWDCSLEHCRGACYAILCFHLASGEPLVAKMRARDLAKRLGVICTC